MKGVYYVTKNEPALEKTISFKKILGHKVLSKGGTIIGKVAEIRIHPYDLNVEGILIFRGPLKKRVYIGKHYFSHISHDALLLNVELSLLLKGKKVITSQGIVLGRVKEVLRKGTTNDLQGVVVYPFLKHKEIIPRSAIKSIGASIILHSSYVPRKKYLWQRLE